MAKARITLVLDYELRPANYHGCHTIDDMFDLEKYYLEECPSVFLKEDLIVSKKLN